MLKARGCLHLRNLNKNSTELNKNIQKNMIEKKKNDREWKTPAFFSGDSTLKYSWVLQKRSLSWFFVQSDK